MIKSFKTVLGVHIVQHESGALFHLGQHGELNPIPIVHSKSGLVRIKGVTPSWMYLDDALLWYAQHQQTQQLQREVASLQDQLWEIRSHNE
jgi:hypothetical protein